MHMFDRSQLIGHVLNLDQFISHRSLLFQSEVCSNKVQNSCAEALFQTIGYNRRLYLRKFCYEKGVGRAYDSSVKIMTKNWSNNCRTIQQ